MQCYLLRFNLCRNLFLVSALLGSLLIHAQPVISFQPVINGLSSPVDVVNANDNSNRLFVVELGGTIKVYDQSYNYLGDFLTVSGLITSGEQGLLSIAFPPNYSSTGYFFVYYTNSDGDVELARYHVSGNANVADPNSKQIVLTIPHPGQTNHNGGKLNFGTDGYLYFATGDGGAGQGNNAQDGTILLGKMIRIAVNTTASGPLYTIPSDNPYAAANDNIRDEIWAMGLRNPFRWSFDRLTHDLWLADVGEEAWEEIDHRTNGNTGGINYGWPCLEGTHTFTGTGGCPVPANYASPILEYPHDPVTGGEAVIGGFVYRGTLNPAMYGYYLFADEVSSNVWALPLGGTAADTVQYKTILPLISSFGEAENGELYVTSLSGQLFNVLATGNSALPVKLLHFDGVAKSGYNEITWSSTAEQQLKQYEIEFSSDAIHFQQAGIVAAANSGSYIFKHITNIPRLYYRLKPVDLDGQFSYSGVITVASSTAGENIFIRPSVISNHVLNVQTDGTVSSLHLINMEGKEVFTRSVANTRGSMSITIPSLPAGQYLVRMQGNGKQLTQKIFIQ